ncbi:hypothetical protein ACHAQH_003520 [Verticillium albo-atrum]
MHNEALIKVRRHEKNGEAQTHARKASDEETVMYHDQVFSPKNSRSSSWETHVDDVEHAEKNKLEVPSSPVTVLFRGDEGTAYDSPGSTGTVVRYELAEDAFYDARSVLVNCTDSVSAHGEHDDIEADSPFCEASNVTLKPTRRPIQDVNDYASLSSQNWTRVRVSSFEELMQRQFLESFREREGSAIYEFDLVGEIDIANGHESILDAEEYYNRGLIQDVHADIIDGVVSRVQTSNDDQRDKDEGPGDGISADHALERAINKSLSAYLESPGKEAEDQAEFMNSENGVELEQQRDGERITGRFTLTADEDSPSEYSSQGGTDGSTTSFGSTGHEDTMVRVPPRQGHFRQIALSPIPEFPTPVPSPIRSRHRDPVKASPRFTLDEASFQEWIVNTADLYLVPDPLKGHSTRAPPIPPRSSSRTRPAPGGSSDLSELINQFPMPPTYRRPTTPIQEERSYFDCNDSPCSAGRLIEVPILSSAQNLIKGFKSFFKSGTEPTRRPAGVPTLRRTVRHLFSKGKPGNSQSANLPRS